MSFIGAKSFGAAYQSPPRLPKQAREPAEESPADVAEKAEGKSKDKRRLAKLALGVGAGLGTVAAFASPVGQAYLQETHLLQCLGLPDPLQTGDLIDLSVESQLPAGVPSHRATPTQNKAWWDGLSKQQQNDLLRNHPHALGDRDGLPAEVRDQANRTNLEMAYQDLEQQHETVRAQVEALGDQVGRGLPERTPRIKLEALESRLADLRAVRKSVAEGEGRYLLSFQPEGEVATAVVADGNPDTAEHIAVTVPGVNTGVRSLPRMMREGDALKDEATLQLTRVGRGEESISTIAWVGYETPSYNTEGNLCEKISDGLSAASLTRARNASGDLNRFYKGLETAHEQGEDPNITAIGHSYGSLATSLALQQGGHGVDNLVVYGSPGLELDRYSDLGLEPGRSYEMTAINDGVAEKVGQIRWFGEPTKSRDDLVHLSTQTAEVNGVKYGGAVEHSDYPRTDDNGRVLISGHNVAAVISGLPDNALRVG